MDFKGFVASFHVDVLDGQDPYRVWDADLKNDAGESIEVKVGGWFFGQIHENQKLKVSGSIEQHDGCLHADSVTDLETDATFLVAGAEPVRQVKPPIVGTTNNVFDLTLQPAGIAGYVFDVRDQDGGAPHSVLMRGGRRKGAALFNSRKVRLSGNEDSGHVIHTNKVEYLDHDGAVTGVVKVTPYRRGWAPVATVLVAAIIAVVPWLFNANFQVPTPVLAGWSAVCVLVGVLAGWQYWRRRRP